MTNDHDKILCERLATSIDHGICKCAERSRIAAIGRELDYARLVDECIRKDAARYRWLKINARRIDFAGLCVSDGAQLDARIDAAMSKD